MPCDRHVLRNSHYFVVITRRQHDRFLDPPSRSLRDVHQTGCRHEEPRRGNLHVRRERVEPLGYSSIDWQTADAIRSSARRIAFLPKLPRRYRVTNESVDIRRQWIVAANIVEHGSANPVTGRLLEL